MRTLTIEELNNVSGGHGDHIQFINPYEDLYEDLGIDSDPIYQYFINNGVVHQALHGIKPVYIDSPYNFFK